FINMYKKREWVFSFLLFLLLLISGIGMMFLKGTPLLHIRLPAEIYLIALLVLMLGLKNLRIRKPLEWSVVGIAAIFTLQSLMPSKELDRILPSQLRAPVQDIPHWWIWNMAGIEAKPNADHVQGVWDYLKNIE